MACLPRLIVLHSLAFRIKCDDSTTTLGTPQMFVNLNYEEQYLNDAHNSADILINVQALVQTLKTIEEWI